MGSTLSALREPWVDGRSDKSRTEVPLNDVFVGRKGHGGKGDAETVPPRFDNVFRLWVEGTGHGLR